jgi:uncharacterized sulfatase
MFSMVYNWQHAGETEMINVQRSCPDNFRLKISQIPFHCCHALDLYHVMFGDVVAVEARGIKRLKRDYPSPDEVIALLEFTSHSYDGHMFNGDMERFKDFPIPGDLAGTEGDWKAEYPDYLGCINSLDANLGRIVDQLKQSGMLDDTVIVFTSDHGSHFKTRNTEYKRSCHEGCIRIPLVINGPGFRGGKVVRELVSLINLPPTILEIAGLPVPGDMHEESLMPLVRGDAPDWQKEVFLQISESQVGRAIRTDRWKYSVTAPDQDRRFGSRSEVYVEDFLYDLHADPYERNNLVGDPALAGVRAELAERLKQRMRKAAESVPKIIPAAPG